MILIDSTRNWLSAAGPPLEQPTSAQICAYISSDMEALADKLELILGWDAYVVSALRINSHAFYNNSEYMVTSVERAINPQGVLL